MQYMAATLIARAKDVRHNRAIVQSDVERWEQP